MLYRQSVSVPPMFAGEFSTTEEVNSPSLRHVELREDEDRVFLKVAEAGQKILRLYRQLHRVHLVNYTFLATHHLFMAGEFRSTLSNDIYMYIHFALFWANAQLTRHILPLRHLAFSCSAQPPCELLSFLPIITPFFLSFTNYCRPSTMLTSPSSPQLPFLAT